MPGPILQADDVADLVSVTLRDLGRGRWTDIAGDLQEYVALPNIFRRNRIAFGSGFGVSYNLMTKTSGGAEHTGLFSVDNVDVGDVMATGVVPWRHTDTKFAIDRREIAMNRNPARIVELVKVRRADAMIDLAKLIETAWWGDPAATNEPFGVPYWIVRNATAGFNGGDPTNFSAGAAGITVASVPRHSNYTDRYTSITKTDLIRKMRGASTKTMFISPVAVPTYNTGNRRQVYTNYDVIQAAEELLEAQNDALGPDVASMDGRLVFRKIPVTWVPHLDSEFAGSATDPVIGIDYGVFKVAFLRGEYLRETGPKVAGNSHNTLHVFVDLTYNFVCYDRRRNWIVDKA